jgi:PadR family transcriptional regulator, regulatory protein PadR
MAEPLSHDLLPGTLYMMILRTLSDGPLHGYAIAKQIKAASRDLLAIEDGSLYPALNRMLVKGWLAAEWGVSENNRNARFYRLTPKGRKQLETETEKFNQVVRAVGFVMGTA